MRSITSEKGWTRLYAFLKWKQQDGQGPGSWNAGRWEQKEPGHTPEVALFPLGYREGTLGVCLAVGAAHMCAQAHAALPAHSAEQWLQWPVLPERAYLTSRWESTKEAWKWTQWSRLLAFHPLKDENIREGVTSQFALAEQGGKENLWAGWGPGDLCWSQPGGCCAEEQSKVCVWGWWPSSERWGGLKVLWGEGKDAPAAGIIWGPGLCSAGNSFPCSRLCVR